MTKNIALAAILVASGIGLAAWFSVRAPRPVRAGQSTDPQIVLYTGENFTGRSLSFSSTALDLPKEEERDGSLFDWNDQVRSLVVVRGTWRLYQHGRSNTRLDGEALDSFDIRTKQVEPGWSTLVSARSTGQLEVADVAQAGLAMDISSLELVSQENLPDWAFVMRKP